MSAFRRLKRLLEQALARGLLYTLRFLHDLALVYGVFFACIIIDELHRLILDLLRLEQDRDQPAAGAPGKLAEGPGADGQTQRIGHMAFSPVGHYLAYADGRLVNVYSLLTRTSLTFSGHAGEITALAWSPDGLLIASAEADGAVRVWEFASGRDLLTYTRHTQPVLALAWSPDGTRIASGGVGGTLNIWNAQDGRATLECAGAHLDAVTCIAWSSFGDCLLSGDRSGRVYLWDAEAGTVVEIYAAHERGVTTVAWCPDPGRRMFFATSSHDGYVKIWDARAHALLYSYVGHTGPGDGSAGGAITCAWSPDGRRIISADPIETVQEWCAPLGARQPLVAITIPISMLTPHQQKTPLRSMAVRQVQQPHQKQGTLLAVAGDGWIYMGPSPADPAAMIGDSIGGRLSPLQPTEF